MLKTFGASGLVSLGEMISDYAREHRLRIDCFSVVYNGRYEALVKFGARL